MNLKSKSLRRGATEHTISISPCSVRASGQAVAGRGPVDFRAGWLFGDLIRPPGMPPMNPPEYIEDQKRKFGSIGEEELGKKESYTPAGEEDGGEERATKSDAYNKAAEQIWLASHTLWTVAEKEKACASASHDMPNDFGARIRESDVRISDVADVMDRAVNTLCARRPPDTTGATEHGRPAMMMKEHNVIKSDWEKLFKIRRSVEKDDTKSISDKNICIELYDMWMSKWLYENLTKNRRRTKKQRAKAAMFEAWLRGQYGSKRFVMAIFETGMSCAIPSGAAEHISPYTDMPIGAAEHTTPRVMKWSLKVVKAIGCQKRKRMVKKQRWRSGLEQNSSGLAEEEKELRAARDQARADAEYGAMLHRRLELREGKGNITGQRENWLWPMAWHQMSPNQQWYVCEFLNGDLMKAKEAAEENYERREVETMHFTIDF